MAAEAEGHSITISFVQEPPAEVAPGADTVLRARVQCSEGCDLRGSSCTLVDQDELMLKRFYLTQFYGVNESDALVLRAPVTPGRFTLTAVYPEQQKNGTTHHAASVTCGLTVAGGHQTSIAVWDIASPAAAGSRFTLKAGVRCSADCKLDSKEVRVYDHLGSLAGTGSLKAEILPGTTAMYWALVELDAPALLGPYTWTVAFSDPDGSPPHLNSGTSFGFTVTDPPDCQLQVKVISQADGKPVEGADVIVHPYRSRTGADGIAQLSVFGGEYRVYVSKGGYQVFDSPIDATDGLVVEALLLPAPPPEID